MSQAPSPPQISHAGEMLAPQQEEVGMGKAV